MSAQIESAAPHWRSRPGHRERSFGLSIGTVLLGVAIYFLWRGHIEGAGMASAAGALLLGLGLLRPRLLELPSAIWWRVSRALGHVNARVVLTLIFVLVFAPIGLLWRIIGRDPLERRLSNWKGWSPHPSRYRNRSHYSRMY